MKRSPFPGILCTEVDWSVVFQLVLKNMCRKDVLCATPPLLCVAKSVLDEELFLYICSLITPTKPTIGGDRHNALNNAYKHTQFSRKYELYEVYDYGEMGKILALSLSKNMIEIRFADCMLRICAMGNTRRQYQRIDPVPSYTNEYLQLFVGCILEGVMMVHEMQNTFILLTTDGMQFPFVMHCLDQRLGYSSSWVSVRLLTVDGFAISSLTPDEITAIHENKNAELIIVVGLPGSGKSTYARGRKDVDLIYDDESRPNPSKPFCAYHLRKAHTMLLENKKICFVWARFTSYIYYRNFISFFGPTVHSKITTICFGNDPSQCHKNALGRIHPLDVEKDIDNMSVYYDLSPDVYINAVHMDVFKTSLTQPSPSLYP
jgi:hypothetical protein